MCYVKFKETNQIGSPLKISQAINAESKICDWNNKCSCIYEGKRILGCLMYREEKKTEDGENLFLEDLVEKIY